MANITIQEVSQNYAYNIAASNYATVAMPITAAWGPAFEDPATMGISLDDMLDRSAFSYFPATQAGLESFNATYRGPAANYRQAQDYSYQTALTLLTAGYSVLVCRLSPGAHAAGSLTSTAGSEGSSGGSGGGGGGGTLVINAKYPGTFGNNLKVVISKIANRNAWSLITYALDASGTSTALENLTFTFEIDHSTDSIPHITEVASSYLVLTVTGTITDSDTFGTSAVTLMDGTDRAAFVDATTSLANAVSNATNRYTAVGYDDKADYIVALSALTPASVDQAKAQSLEYMEWLYTNAYQVYELLTDKLAYNPQRIISPGWDDQNISNINGAAAARLSDISPLHIKLMDVAYRSRCATALIDNPRSASKASMWNESADPTQTGYAQLLARYVPNNESNDTDVGLYATHSALCAPWAQYVYAGTSKMAIASPSFLVLMIERAMILNQSIQYEWALPTIRRQNLVIGPLAWAISKKTLDTWQTTNGVGINVITNIPDLGTVLWGNSTLIEVPPATYQALANKSTRYLVNALNNIVYRAGISITFQYNNDQAYSTFYAATTPILDTMKNVGAISDYYIRMATGLDLTGQVEANTVVGAIYLVVNGVVNDIQVDLIALPPNTDLTQYKAS
jgi:hypothetical protein